ncbi:MAG: CAP domain-containing protein [Actinomycetota bacterium]
MTSSRAHFRSRFGLIAVAGLVAVGMISWVPTAGSGTKRWFSATERCVMKEINDVRARNGLHPINWDRQLGFLARRHARTIARAGGLWHDNNLGDKVTRWRRLGQNTGRGGPCRRIMRTFMGSYEHRDNILGRWRFMGVGTKWAGHRLYVQQVFEARKNPGNTYHRP